MMALRIAFRLIAGNLAIWGCIACIDSGAAQVPSGKSPATPRQGLTDGGDSLRIIAHDEITPVGFPAGRRPLVLRNPYEGNKSAIGTGARLFISYNCIDCHGADGSGAMGPSFQDGRWHFGGSPGAVFESIYQGRPEGMPAWGGRITDDQIWMLTAYVRSLASADISTENFSGQTVERTGH
ncbi:MAG TPA: c-type cytochrome [Gemmatimonadaceae bacterium]|nr:c-type cytochrome [Gemmatimonadaceae bacterium]